MQRAEQLHLVRASPRSSAIARLLFKATRAASLSPCVNINDNPKRRLKMHLLAPAARGIVERENRPLRPAMTFSQQGHRQENRRGGGGKSDANFGIAVDAKAPFQGRADIVEIGKAGRSRLPVVLQFSRDSPR